MIEEWPSWNCNKKLTSVVDQFMRFCPTIWRWDLSVRGLFRVVSASRWRTETHIACAAIPRREKHSCHHPTTVLSGSRSEWLSAVPYSENGPQGDAFRTMEDIESNATTELRKIPKEAFRQCIQQWQDRWSKCVCVRKGRWLGKRCHMSYHYSAIPQFRELCDCPSYKPIPLQCPRYPI